MRGVGRALDSGAWASQDGFEPLEGVEDRLRLVACTSDDSFVGCSGEASCRWASNSLCAEVEVAGEFGEPGPFPGVVLVSEAVAERFGNSLEQRLLAFGRYLEAGPFRVGSDLMA